MIKGDLMGLFDKFRRKVRNISEETDTEELTEPESPRINQREIPMQNELKSIQSEKKVETTVSKQETEWDEWDEPLEESSEEPWKKLSKKERKKQKKELQKKNKEKKLVTKPKGSRVDLQMMRSTTGRQLVKVKEAPRGSSGIKEIDLGEGKNIQIDLGGGVVESGGRAIKDGKALNALLEEIEWAMLESDISSGAVTDIMTLMKENLIGSRLRKGADLSKVIEATIKRALQSILKADYWDFYATVENIF